MSRKRLLLFGALGTAGAVVAWLLLSSPPAGAPPPAPAPAPRAERPKPALQSDAEGHYEPGYEFSVNGYRFTGFTLRPEAVLRFASAAAGTRDEESCAEARITSTTVHLRCDFPREGTVTIDGRFLTRLATTRLDAAVLSAVVTVRTGSGDVVYNARDSFVWHPAE